VEVFRSYERKALKRRSVDIWYKGYASGYQAGNHEGIEYFADRVILELREDAVLSMTADLDTLERFVEIIEAVRDNGKTQDD
jgi:hypothetical protein